MTAFISVIAIDPFYRSARITCFPRGYVDLHRLRMSEICGWIDGRDAGRYHFSFTCECVIQGPGTTVGRNCDKTQLAKTPIEEDRRMVSFGSPDRTAPLARQDRNAPSSLAWLAQTCHKAGAKKQPSN